MGPKVAGTHSYIIGKKGGRGSLPPPTHNFASALLSSPPKQARRTIPKRVPFQPLVDIFDSKGGDYGEPYNGDSNYSANGDKGQHSNVSDMAIHAEDSGIDDWSVPDSHTTDAYSVDLLYSD